jgi:hypothetical protein
MTANGILGDPDFLRWKELRAKPSTVYVCVPLNLDTHGEKYVRLLVESLLASKASRRLGSKERN